MAKAKDDIECPRCGLTCTKQDERCSFCGYGLQPSIPVASIAVDTAPSEIEGNDDGQISHATALTKQEEWHRGDHDPECMCIGCVQRREAQGENKAIVKSPPIEELPHKKHKEKHKKDKDKAIVVENQTLEQLQVDNESLRKRVVTLEEAYKDNHRESKPAYRSVGPWLCLLLVIGLLCFLYWWYLHYSGGLPHEFYQFLRRIHL